MIMSVNWTHVLVTVDHTSLLPPKSTAVVIVISCEQLIKVNEERIKVIFKWWKWAVYAALKLSHRI